MCGIVPGQWVATGADMEIKPQAAIIPTPDCADAMREYGGTLAKAVEQDPHLRRPSRGSPERGPCRPFRLLGAVVCSSDRDSKGPTCVGRDVHLTLRASRGLS